MAIAEDVNTKNDVQQSAMIVAWILMLFRRAIVTGIDGWTGLNQSICMGVIYIVSIGILALYYLKHCRAVIVHRGILLVFAMGLLYFISIIKFSNMYLWDFFRTFVLYCIPGALITMQIKDYKKAIYYYCVTCLIIFLTCGLLPRRSSSFAQGIVDYYESYMSFGEWVMAPCLIGLSLLRLKYRKIWIIVFEILGAVITFVFANRSSILVWALFYILYELFYREHSLKKYILIVAMFFAAIILAHNLPAILLFFNDHFLIPAGINSRSVIKYISLFNQGITFERFLSGRNVINSLAMESFFEHPITGIGIGTFRINTGYHYAHNFILDCLSTFGLPAGGIILGVFVYTVLKVFWITPINKDVNLFAFVLLMQCFPRLLFSKTFVDDVPFWMYFCFIFSVGLKNTAISNSYIARENHEKA